MEQNVTGTGYRAYKYVKFGRNLHTLPSQHPVLPSKEGESANRIEHYMNTSFAANEQLEAISTS